MRSRVIILAALGLGACTSSVPDSGAGVGFGDYGSYNSAPAYPAPQPAAPAAGFSPDAALAAIDKAEGKVPEGTPPLSVIPSQQPLGAQPAPPPVTATGERPRGNAPTTIQEDTAEMANVPGSAVYKGPAGTVSDEQDFQAVTQRETIESDKARIERNRAQYQVDQPTALPQRAGDTGPNIVEFALSTTHPRGTQMYKRSSLRLNSYNAACSKYASPDLAQQAFLAAGGPDRDRKGLDPDGDGYACAWDPTPFRAALN